MSIATPHPAITSQVQSSELSRNSAEVFHAAERGPVLVTRRDAEPLVLTSKAAADETDQVLSAAASLIGVAVMVDPEVFAQRLTDAFPWAAALSENERALFADELIASARACFSLKQHNLFLGTLNGWRGTAEAYAAGLRNVSNDWLDVAAEVTDPRAS
ncbi:hypothetical protein [Salinibacterium sp. NK8237]|uniref:hypothetical protein n=1 Tax=Salinibacterium sp. NK8237 TaxID=2792038 RepID=UPI0018CEB9DD|nr:hypothetical protein [Salinibacterium sp. NK8237]MBH0130520.1 hypothetical protein [Salinibacterium sp. NK8237]